MKRLLTCVALITIMVGCKEPLSEEPIIPDGKLPINLSLSTTRANDSSYEAGDQIGLYVANYADGAATQLANSGNHVNNMQFTLNDNSWTPATKIYWKDKSTRADFYAYYPYQSTVADVTAMPVSVQADQSSEDNYWASDLLWGKTSGVAPTESVVNIATSHALSNLLIYVEPGYGFTAESLAAANVSVEINNVMTAGTLNLTNGVVTALGESGTIAPWNTGEYYRALVVPQTVADENTLITVTVDGKAHTIERSFTFVANTQHKFVVRIEKDFETKVTLSINPWNQDPNINGDIAMPNNEIWYTSTTGNIIGFMPDSLGVFGANLISNTYANGKGVLRFDNDVTNIGQNAFSYSPITSITLPESVTSVGIAPFFGCYSLTEFKGKFASADGHCLIVDGVLNSFAIAAGLTEYVIPDSVSSIEPTAFMECSSLTTISIPESVTSIGQAAFSCCSSLQSITIPNSIVYIGGNILSDCEKLEYINGKYASVDHRCLIVDGVLNSFAPAGLTEYMIPDYVTSIGRCVFTGLKDITAITLPENITSIGEYAFSYCSITSITLPERVESIGDGAFIGCYNLKSIFCKPAYPPTLGSPVFNYNASDRKIFVPASDDDSIINAYKSANYWSNYASAIVEYEFD